MGQKGLSMARSAEWQPRPMDARLPAMSILGRSVWGRSGPVWSMAAVDLALAAIFAGGAFSAIINAEPSETLVVAAIATTYWFASAVGLMWLGRQAPMWLLNTLLGLSSLAIGVISVTRTDDFRAGISMLAFVVIVVYAATWLPRVQMWLQFSLVFVLMLLVVVLHDFDLELRAIWFEISIILVFLGVFVNALVRDVHKQAILDPLTGLLNRTGLSVIVDSRSGERAEGLPRAVVVIDLDGFKAVNDVRGHHAGDDLLRQVGSVMKGHLRPSDAAARIGGDEFLILLPNTSVEEARIVMARLVQELPVSCSYGIAEWAPGTSFEDSAKVADYRMFEHKRRQDA